MIDDLPTVHLKAYDNGRRAYDTGLWREIRWDISAQYLEPGDAHVRVTVRDEAVDDPNDMVVADIAVFPNGNDITDEAQAIGAALLWSHLRARALHTDQPAPTPDTVEVRIAVAVDQYGDWWCEASDDPGTDSDAASEAARSMHGRTAVSIVTAHVPKPVPVAEVVGTVEASHDD